MTQHAIVDDDDVSCGCAGTCIHAPVLEEVVVPASHPRTVGVLSIDRAGLVAMAHQRGLTSRSLRLVR